ncbi:MAG: AAA family ATPase, partial [Anaerolineae bacterium]
VPPLEETTQLYEAIKEQRGRGAWEHGSVGVWSRGGGEIPPALQPPSTLAQDGPLHPHTLAPLLPLVGRAQERTAFLRAYGAINTDGHFVVLEGEAGIGKTRLAEEFLAHVRAQGGATVAARCYEGETHLAYGPFIEGLRAAVDQPDLAGRLAEVPRHWLSETARLLSELADHYPELPPAPPLDSPGAQSRFFEGISQVVLALCGGVPPGVLFFDDLHWADEASLDLLTYLVRRLRGRPLCILVAWRGEHVSAGHRLHHLLAEAQRAGMGTHLSLSRLSQTDVEQLVRSAAAQGLPREIGERLYRETEGLPFFLAEYLAVMSKDAAPGGADWPLPGSVRDLLHSRLAGVNETGWQLLTTAAVIGRSFDFDTLRAASGRGEEEAVTALEGLMAQGLVREASPLETRDWRLETCTEPSRSIDRRAALISTLQYDFTHEKLRTLVYEETSLVRRRLLHRRVAEALASPGRGRREAGPIASQIAHHFQLAGEDAKAAEHYRLAGEHARSLFASTEALSHFRSALALGHPKTAMLQEAIGDLQTLLGEYGAALTSYKTAAALCDPGNLARVEHKLGKVYHRRGEWEPAESHFQAALMLHEETGPAGERARLHADWSLTAHHRGQTERALELARQALDLAETAGDTRALAQAHNILGILARSQDDLARARHHLEHSLAIAETLDDPAARVAALNNLALVFGDGGKIERALELTETALYVCASQGDRHREAALHNNLADLLHAAGQSEAAMSHLTQAVTIFAEIGEEAGDLQPEIWKLMEW